MIIERNNFGTHLAARIRGAQQWRREEGEVIWVYSTSNMRRDVHTTSNLSKVPLGSVVHYVVGDGHD